MFGCFCDTYPEPRSQRCSSSLLHSGARLATLSNCNPFLIPKLLSLFFFSPSTSRIHDSPCRLHLALQFSWPFGRWLRSETSVAAALEEALSLEEHWGLLEDLVVADGDRPHPVLKPGVPPRKVPQVLRTHACVGWGNFRLVSWVNVAGWSSGHHQI